MNINLSNEYLVISSGRMPGDLNDWDCVVVAAGEQMPEVAQNCPRPEELIFGGNWSYANRDEAEAFKDYRLGTENG